VSILRHPPRYLSLLRRQGTPVIPAFLGAQGWGSTTTHGRGGQVLFIDNLNDSGAGSARQALQVNTDPRIVIPRVSGNIGNLTDLKIRGKCYLAGQAAPGDGLCFYGNTVQIQGEDIVVRHVRVRTGDNQGIGISPPSGNWATRKSIQIGDPDNIGGTRRFVLDHLSVSWAVDECLTALYKSNNGTISWCIISEGLFNSVHPEGPHSMCLDFAGAKVVNMSLHHNLLAHCNERMPQMSGGNRMDFRNNVAYNWGILPFETKNPDNAFNVVSNAYIYGPDRSGIFTGILVAVESDIGMVIYGVGNSDPRGFLGQTANQDNWQMLQTVGGEQIPESFKAGHWLDGPIEAPEVATQEVVEAVGRVLSDAGANKPARDSVDTRVAQDVTSAIHGNLTGNIIDSQEDVGGWPTLSSTTPPTDSNNDGVPDYFALSLGFNVAENCATRVLPDSPYTIVERYLSSLAGDHAP